MRGVNVFAGLCALGMVAISAGTSGAGTVLVNGDEWALSNTGFSQAPDASVFVDNLVAEFGPLIHAYSNNFGYTQSALAAAMNTAGATYTTGLGISFDLPTLSGYDAIFLGGNYLSASQTSILTSYVAGGGNVFISAGTGSGGSVNEANAWNPFLSQYGIELGLTYTGLGGNVTTTGDSLFAGVSQLYVNNPNGIVSGSFCCAEGPVFAVSRMSQVPVPAAGLLLGTALAGIGIRSRRRRRA